MQNPKLSIIIPHYRTPDILRDCLDALEKEIKSIDYEIIISDGESDEKIPKGFKKDFPEVLFVEHKKNVGFARLVNAGIEKSQGDFIFVINADIIVKNEKDILEMVEYLEKNKDAGLMAPRLFNIDGSVQQTYFRNYTPLIILARRTLLGKTSFGKKLLDKFNYKDIKIDGPFEPEWVLGAAFLMERGRFNKIGGKLDERFFMYFEDVDLCRRFKSVGLKVIYYPFTNFIHYHARTSDKGRGIFDIFTNKFTRIHIASYLKYLMKWGIIRAGKFSIKNNGQSKENHHG